MNAEQLPGDIRLDPAGQYTETPLLVIIESLGFIPGWVDEWERRPDAPISLLDYLVLCYRFGRHDMPAGSKLDDYGTYSYPGDPDLFPLAEIITRAGKLWLYEYSIVAIPTDDGHVVVRMD